MEEGAGAGCAPACGSLWTGGSAGTAGAGIAASAFVGIEGVAAEGAGSEGVASEVSGREGSAAVAVGVDGADVWAGGSV
jgi:hypothetical protein